MDLIVTKTNLKFPEEDLNADEKIPRHEAFTSGNVNSLELEFTFLNQWLNLAHVAVFRNGDTSVELSFPSGKCTVPWEVLTEPGDLYVSLRGIGERGNYVICTEAKYLGTVEQSLADEIAAGAQEHTPGVIDTLLADVAELRASSGGTGGGSGADGKSAYQLAVDHGFSGTEVQWLASLKGADGRDGADGMDGINGSNGRDGADGRTPVKGVDYFTTADRAELVSDVIAALPDGDEVSY